MLILFSPHKCFGDRRLFRCVEHLYELLLHALLPLFLSLCHICHRSVLRGVPFSMSERDIWGETADQAAGTSCIFRVANVPDPEVVLQNSKQYSF